ncbi:hypothetical protein [Paraburkholderia sp. RL17-373-BIF-A]|uniref:hypothetical protein n=1 Tax=Paraburkholderia sp. RL17-373-BIF-A TaxID=3031629 RepID=UPI0038BC7BC4
MANVHRDKDFTVHGEKADGTNLFIPSGGQPVRLSKESGVRFEFPRVELIELG